MKDYSELHDQQINTLVCQALELKMSSYARIMTLDDATVLLADNQTLVDYCNNPADAWPIIVDNHITIKPVKRVRNYNEYYDSWEASGVCAFEEHDNPLRAAMIVFLVMQDH